MTRAGTAPAAQRPAAKRPAAKRPAAKRPAAQRPAARGKRAMSARVRRRRLTVVTLVAAILLGGFLVAFVYPTRTFMGQRDELTVANRRLAVLREETRRLDRASSALQSDAEVQRIAREQYGLVLPGETPYVPVQVAPTTPTTLAP